MGIALTKRQWLRQKTFMKGYLSTVAETDYAMRDHDRIIDWFISTGYLPTVTSQDGAKDLAMYASGATKLMTYCCYGKYIGQQGVHSNEQLYESAGIFKNPAMWPIQADRFDWPTPAETNSYIEAQLSRLSKNVALVTELFPLIVTST